MNRRYFTRLSTAGLALAAVPTRLRAALEGTGVVAGPVRAGLPQEIRVDPERLGQRLSELAEFGRNAAGGIDRVAFSDANVEALDWVAGHVRSAGFETEIDVAGNLIARKAGSEPGLRPLMFGSHIDSVPGGGNFDGQVGSMGALEAATTLADAGLVTRHPLELAIFSNEEGGKTGSRALIGAVEPFELDLSTASGYTIGEGLRRLGGDPDRLAEVVREAGSIAGFLELHIEQGGVLDTDGVDIGVVEGIVGIMRWNVIVDGVTNHAGTTPMDRRADAMVSAARFINAVYTTARTVPGRQVATVGQISAEPGVPNVIPGRVRLTLEIRDLSMEGIGQLFAAIEESAHYIGAAAGTTFEFERFYTSTAAPTDERLRIAIGRSALQLGLTGALMSSGAGHDAQSIALLGPIGMIFVPSVDGVSHAPEELTEPEDVVNGANVLLATLLDLDRGGLD